MPINRFTLALFALALWTADATAQAAIPVRTLSPPVATDAGILMSVSGLRALPGGRVLVNDSRRRRIVAFDSTLKSFTITADTAPGAPARWGAHWGLLIPYVGDSTVCVDSPDGSAATAMLVVIDQAGKVVRTMAPPRLSDLQYITATAKGVDAKGRLLYSSRRLMPSESSPPRDGSGKVIVTAQPDSAPILRGDFDKRTVDTIGLYRIPLQKSLFVSQRTGSSQGAPVVNPLPVTDEWVVLPDGAIAIVRGHDYHIDWLQTDRTIKSSPKMPFAWKQITPDDKQRMLDSARQAQEKLRSGMPSSPAPRGASGEAAPPPLRLPVTTVTPDELPDYYPPIRRGTVSADADGNIWILPTTSVFAGGGLTYDVVNRKGEVFERVQLPVGRRLLGFGRGGIVFTGFQPSDGKVVLERARVVRGR